MIKIDFIDTTEIYSKENVLNIAEKTLSEFNIKNAQLEIWFATDEQIQKLNKEYRQIDRPTDVLSFPQVKTGQKNEHLGTLVISQATVQAKNEALTNVVKHGLLHLLGYDHETDLATWDSAAKKINCEL